MLSSIHGSMSSGLKQVHVNFGSFEDTSFRGEPEQDDKCYESNANNRYPTHILCCYGHEGWEAVQDIQEDNPGDRNRIDKWSEFAQVEVAFWQYLVTTTIKDYSLRNHARGLLKDDCRANHSGECCRGADEDGTVYLCRSLTLAMEQK